MEQVPLRVLLFFCLIVFMSVNARPRYIDCVDSIECGVGSCCVLGMGKFSLPRCVPHSEIDEPCKPHHYLSQLPANTSVSYPDGETVDLTNIYYLMCPCSDGLVCSDITATCQDPYHYLNTNSIDFL